MRVSNFRGQNDRMNVRRSAYDGFHIMLLIALIGALPIFLLRNELGGWFSDSPAAVSYTHLDVYKRQPLIPARYRLRCWTVTSALHGA